MAKGENAVTDDRWIYGLHAVTAALDGQGGRIERVILASGRGDGRIDRIRRLAEDLDVTVQVRPRSALDELTGGARHQGAVAERAVAALAEAPAEDLLDVVAKAGRDALVLVLDGVQDPHNLGACLRSADAAGVCAVVVPADGAVGLTATVRKVACGGAEHVPFYRVPNLARTLDTLKDAGLWLVGLAGEAPLSIYEHDLRGPIVLVMGAEEKGMRRLTRERCDYLAAIPMLGSVESLNVSVATGICLFEALRQRRTQGRG